MQILDAVLNISIHALREEGDERPICQRLECFKISIHALREEGDLVVGMAGRTYG